jgi:hypothetical protein
VRHFFVEYGNGADAIVLFHKLVYSSRMGGYNAIDQWQVRARVRGGAALTGHGEGRDMSGTSHGHSLLHTPVPPPQLTSPPSPPPRRMATTTTPSSCASST